MCRTDLCSKTPRGRDRSHRETRYGDAVHSRVQHRRKWVHSAVPKPPTLPPETHLPTGPGTHFISSCLSPDLPFLLLRIPPSGCRVHAVRRTQRPALPVSSPCPHTGPPGRTASSTQVSTPALWHLLHQQLPPLS